MLQTDISRKQQKYAERWKQGVIDVKQDNNDSNIYHLPQYQCPEI